MQGENASAQRQTRQEAGEPGGLRKLSPVQLFIKTEEWLWEWTVRCLYFLTVYFKRIKPRELKQDKAKQNKPGEGTRRIKNNWKSTTVTRMRFKTAVHVIKRCKHQTGQDRIHKNKTMKNGDHNGSRHLWSSCRALRYNKIKQNHLFHFYWYTSIFIFSLSLRFGCLI